VSFSDQFKQPEGRRLEFKERLPSKAELCKSIISFANDAGGLMYIGIKDSPRLVVGVNENDIIHIEEQISNLIFDNCHPIISPEISIISVDDKLIIKVRIYRGSNQPYFLKSVGKNQGTYLRIGSSNRVVNNEIIQEMERLKRNISFDSEPILDLEYQGLNLKTLYALYSEKTGENCNENILKKLHLIKLYQQQLKGTNALLLLSDSDQKSECFPYAKIECARFKGTTIDTFIDRKTLDGSILEQVELAYEFVLRHINQSAVTKGVYTKNHWQYPVKAIREVIRNAVIHRDYSLTGKDIKIAIYDDMVEITSPGKLLPSVQFDDMQARQSEIRNKVIAPFFKHLGLIDQWGNGLKLIASELDLYNGIEFKWLETGLQFQVQFIIKDFLEKSISDVRDSVEFSVRLESGLESRLESGLESKLIINILTVIENSPLSKGFIAKSLKHKSISSKLNQSVSLLLKLSLIERTIPDKPNSRLQKYCISKEGQLFLNRKRLSK